MSKKAFNEKLLLFARANGITQAQIAKDLDMQPAHINRYFKGHSDIGSSHMLKILKTLGVDLDQIISKELLHFAGDDDTAVNDLSSSVEYLLNSLEPIGKQTILSQILSSAKKTSKKRIPAKVEEIIQKEINLI